MDFVHECATLIIDTRHLKGAKDKVEAMINRAYSPEDRPHIIEQIRAEIRRVKTDRSNESGEARSEEVRPKATNSPTKPNVFILDDGEHIMQAHHLGCDPEEEAMYERVLANYIRIKNNRL